MRNLLAVIDRIDRALAMVLLPLVVLLSLSVAGMMVLGIFTRSVLGEPLLGLEEVILLAVMWLYMLGAALASRDRTHLSADFVTVFVHNPVLRRRIHVLVQLISLITAVAFIIWSYDLLAWGLDKQQSTTALQIPLYMAQGSMFCASLLIAFYLLRDIVVDVDEAAGGDH